MSNRVTRKGDQEGLHRLSSPTKDGSPRPEAKTGHFRQRGQCTHTYTHTHRSERTPCLRSSRRGYILNGFIIYVERLIIPGETMEALRMH